MSKLSTVIFREPKSQWLLFAAILLLLTVIYYDGLKDLVTAWSVREEYGYGFLIPAISIFFIWQKKDQLELEALSGSWAGFLIVATGLALYFLGELSTLYTIIQYSLVFVIWGVAVAWVGWRGVRILWGPLLLPILMIPLPQFLYQNLSSKLQLISSELGVAFIRLFGVSVYLEGNVIDLGSYKLQVVEACSGLRYLFPLVALSFIAAYIFKGAFWKRAVIVLSSIPITIIMNSFRIGVIGILVDHWGVEQAEGFLHYFEGWVVFMACMGILILEMWVLASVGPDKLTLREAFGLDFPPSAPQDASIKSRKIRKPVIAATALAGLVAISSFSIQQREEVIPPRVSFSEFPLEIGQWEGKPDRLEQIYLDILKLDDYIIADYRNSENKVVNFYSAYYGSQRKGESAHSPRSCLPGGGWQIADLSERAVDGVLLGNKPLYVNRVVIKKGDHTQLVYYWFQQRGRVITNEYSVKWLLFWDALTRNRTDGALVRLTAFVAPGEDIQEADRSLTTFAQDVSSVLESYIPN